jgi:hypothetical protein
MFRKVRNWYSGHKYQKTETQAEFNSPQKLQ